MATEKNLKKLTIHKLKKKTYNALAEKPVDELVMLTDVGGQVAEITEASSDYVGEIVQYVGVTNDTYTNGYFYKCIETDGVYSWAQVNVQEGGGGASLPDQTGNAGKFLKTDGSEVSWGEALVNKTTYYPDIAMIIGGEEVSQVSSACVLVSGANGKVTSGATAIGANAQALGFNSIAIGRSAKTNSNCIQLDCSGSTVNNNDANTFKVSNENGNFEIMSADGTIPTDRYTITPTDAGTYVPKLTIAEDGTATREWGTESGGAGGGDFLPLSGGTISGTFGYTSPALIISGEGSDVYGIELRQRDGKGVVFSANGAGGFSITPNSGTRYLFFGNLTYDNIDYKLSKVKILNNGADLNVPTEGGTLARLEDLEGLGGASLPDQTDNAGKFLMTDGETASWTGGVFRNVLTDKLNIMLPINGGFVPEVSYSQNNNGVFYGSINPKFSTVNASGAVAIGFNNWAQQSVGNQSVALTSYGYAKGDYSLALGRGAKTDAECCIQIGEGTNTEARSLYVGFSRSSDYKIPAVSYKLLDADGNVPRERLKNLVEVLPTADNGYTTVKNFGNNYIEATGIYEVGSVEANAEVVEVIAFPEGVQFEEGQMYWANAHATTEDTNGNTVVANVISRGSSDITIVYKNLGSTDVENLTICWEVRGVVAPK